MLNSFNPWPFKFFNKAKGFSGALLMQINPFASLILVIIRYLNENEENPSFFLFLKLLRPTLKYAFFLL